MTSCNTNVELRMQTEALFCRSCIQTKLLLKTAHVRYFQNRFWSSCVAAVEMLGCVQILSTRNARSHDGYRGFGDDFVVCAVPISLQVRYSGFLPSRLEHGLAH